MCDSYITVGKRAISEFVEKKSKFIGYVKPVSTEGDALSFINEIKSRHWDARHNVFAYVVRENNIARYSDDGEPHGTAGVPILDIIKRNNLQNVVVVVTRYFGGILLGTGGLVRAYSQAASSAIDLARVVEMVCCYDCGLQCDYNQYGKAANIISECGGVVDKTDFSGEVSVGFHVRKKDFSALSKKILEMSSGALQCNILGENFYSA